MSEVLSAPEEKRRIETLKDYQILDTPADGSFDRLTALAAKLFNVPIAIVSLVDENRIWFKSHHGLEIDQIDRKPGLCASAIYSPDVYVVENAAEDIRTLANPLVAGEFGFRFYAAAPLISKQGYKLGTFCIIDKKQRYLNDTQKEILKELADIVMDDMELRLSARNSGENMQLLLKLINSHLQKTLKHLEKDSQKNGGTNELMTETKDLLKKTEDLQQKN